VALPIVVLVVVLLAGGVVQAVVIRHDLLAPLAVPLDGGRSWRGARIFGDNKTIRGAVVMVAATTVAAAVLLPLAPPSDEVPAVGWAGLGALMGLGYIAAELPNSFVKRRLGIAPGSSAAGRRRAVQYLVDQTDSVVGVDVVLWMVLGLPVGELVVLGLVGVTVHVLFDLLLHRVGVKGHVMPPSP
jgi:hypothetical protein